MGGRKQRAGRWLESTGEKSRSESESARDGRPSVTLPSRIGAWLLQPHGPDHCRPASLRSLHAPGPSPPLPLFPPHSQVCLDLFLSLSSALWVSEHRESAEEMVSGLSHLVTVTVPLLVMAALVFMAFWGLLPKSPSSGVNLRVHKGPLRVCSNFIGEEMMAYTSTSQSIPEGSQSRNCSWNVKQEPRRNTVDRLTVESRSGGFLTGWWLSAHSGQGPSTSINSQDKTPTDTPTGQSDPGNS